MCIRDRIYGGGSAQKVIIAKTPNLLIDKIDFGKTLVSSGSSNLIGNRFFENYSIILDWNAKKIYFEKTDNIPQSDTTFGFGYRFINNKATVVQVAQKPLSELHLGD